MLLPELVVVSVFPDTFRIFSGCDPATGHVSIELPFGPLGISLLLEQPLFLFGVAFLGLLLLVEGDIGAAGSHHPIQQPLPLFFSGRILILFLLFL